MSKDRPEILFAPPLGLVLSVICALGLDAWWPLGLFPPRPWMPGILAGIAIMAFAIYTSVSGLLAFRRAGTNVNPYRPALVVVRDGAFRYTRNPMYLGLIAFILALGPMLSNAWAVILAALLWTALHWGVVRREEAYMEAKFGDDYRALLATTRRWL